MTLTVAMPALAPWIFLLLALLLFLTTMQLRPDDRLRFLLAVLAVGRGVARRVRVLQREDRRR